MEELKSLLMDLSGAEIDFTAEKQGVCEFCGERKGVSNKVVLEKIKGSNHPGTAKSQEGLPFICEDCSYIYSVISTTRPSKLFKDRLMLVIEGDRYYYLEDLDQIKNMPEGRYFFVYPLSTSNFMPVNFYDLKPTVNPRKNLNINCVKGSVFETFEIETDRFFELIDSNDKSLHIINSIRKKYRG